MVLQSTDCFPLTKEQQTCYLSFVIWQYCSRDFKKLRWLRKLDLVKEIDNEKELWEIESIIAEFRITIGKLEDAEEEVSQKV